MPLLTRFDTPASVRDVPATSPFYARWSDFVANLIGDQTPGSPAGGFFDPTARNATVAGTKGLVWMGFPRDVLLPGNRDDKRAAYVDADNDPGALGRRIEQNEYFEWYAHRNSAGKITKLTFVTEFEHYYEELWAVSPTAVLDLYKAHVSPAVTLASLSSGSAYNKLNDWNTKHGIMHLIQSINNLPAAVGLAEGAVSASPPTRDNYETFPGLATQTTSVDPRVSYDVHMLARKGLWLSFEDPVGIYILHWDNAGITRPDGGPAPASWWKIARGVSGMVLRLEYEVPASEGFVVGDLELAGHRIERGGQLAEHIAVGIRGIAGTLTRG
jgi:hypothetical protein